ncbi:MAG TPA: indolepyruvate ferredoxin oxidoreductase subunit alpha [Desulfobacteraceae bacterium]|mgnify:CR=1 FL=1|nr:indolepyruvate ferredoxin oxidoreductase subunit alpha [Desulfobacteraceae bacterium]HPJ68043.1 indolepyruvate ferredoxin oxidoreductase subunit alpha [Desulfobacteraceae bacterium]
MEHEEIMLGNGAIALGLVESGCQMVTSYPGTPSSEILPEVISRVKAEGLNTYTEWSTNEKVALDNAFAAAVAGKRSACCMKQVGLNVAADSLMSAAYIGNIGGLLIISCDDPGPHSSQTEQDTRFMARLAKVPVLDPGDPQEAREMVKFGMDLSEEFQIPVVLRPAIRVCHARQNISPEPIKTGEQKASFEKNPSRWAATPKFRLMLHGELNRKLKEIGERFSSANHFNFHNLEHDRHYALGIVAGGVPSAVIRDILAEEGRNDIPLLKIGTPFPFPDALADEFASACDRLLVIEETDTLIEYLLRDRNRVLGRLTGHVPEQGELVPEVVYGVVNRVLKELGLNPFKREEDIAVRELVKNLELPVRRPSLCPGCPHRASFYAIRKAIPKAIFTSDIGCYTLGLNLGGVDTCLDMGAAITMASGFYHSFEQDGKKQPIVATIGDSTFFHSGTAGLLNAVYNNARFVLVILDNEVTAMTGMQPTPGIGIRADGSEAKSISLERIVSGCGVEYIEVVDPYDLEGMNTVLKKAFEYTESRDGGIAAIISRHPCVIDNHEKAIPKKIKVQVTDDCTSCNFCLERFECPALYYDDDLGRVNINRHICADCGLCIQVCPQKAIVEVKEH